MFDNTFTLEQNSEIFCYAFHPHQPILSLGLVTGHVETYRLPQIDQNANQRQPIKSKFARERPKNGLGVVESIWRTHRHKGSCRALAFSSDGSTLYSAGTDGLLKAADPFSGRVVGKIALSTKNDNSDNNPSVMLALSEQTLVVGRDSGSVHIYALDVFEATVPSPSSQSNTGASKYLVPQKHPSRTHRPHISEENPNVSESITSITAVPPSARSTSGTSRSFITTCGDTLALTDIHKGVVVCSIPQDDDLLSCVYVEERGANMKRDKTSSQPALQPHGIVLVGTSSGQLQAWLPGRWQDRCSASTVSDQKSEAKVALPHDPSLNCVGQFPRTNALKNIHTASGYPKLAAGSGQGQILIIGVEMRNERANITAFESLTHDESGVDEVSAIDFDVYGRMISIGGSKLKIWHPKTEEQSHVDGANALNGSEGIADEEATSEEEGERRLRKRSRRRRKSASLENSNHRILKVNDLE